MMEQQGTQVDSARAMAEQSSNRAKRKLKVNVFGDHKRIIYELKLRADQLVRVA